MPYPNKKLSSWPDVYKIRGTRKQYFERLLPIRTKLIRGVLESSKRELIIVFGKGHWKAYADIFGIDLENSGRETFLKYDWRGAQVIFCPHFVSRPFNANTSLSEFARFALDVQSDAAFGILHHTSVQSE